MGVRTREEYVESLRRQRPNVYMDGQKIENLVDHPAFRTGITRPPSPTICLMIRTILIFRG